MSTSTVRAGSRRELTSDFLLIQLPGSPMYIPFRDVFAVDGSLVRDREQRLTKILLQPSPTALAQANQISLESARYNLDSNNVKRTINDPLFALGFLQEGNQPRFRYELEGRDIAEGADVWIVKYREQARPTFVRGAFDKGSSSKRAVLGREVTGVATYGRFRRFDVSTSEAVADPR